MKIDQQKFNDALVFIKEQLLEKPATFEIIRKLVIASIIEEEPKEKTEEPKEKTEEPKEKTEESKE